MLPAFKMLSLRSPCVRAWDLVAFIMVLEIYNLKLLLRELVPEMIQLYSDLEEFVKHYKCRTSSTR